MATAWNHIELAKRWLEAFIENDQAATLYAPGARASRGEHHDRALRWAIVLEPGGERFDHFVASRRYP